MHGFVSNRYSDEQHANEKQEYQTGKMWMDIMSSKCLLCLLINDICVYLSKKLPMFQQKTNLNEIFVKNIDENVKTSNFSSPR